MSVENDAPTGSGLRKSTKLLVTTGTGSPTFCNFKQTLEGQDIQRIAKGTSSAQQLTLSFWVKSNVTGTYICELYDADNTRQVSASYTISASGTWVKKTITFPADTTGPFDNDNAGSLDVSFGLAFGSTWTSGTLNTTWASVTSANRYAGQTNLAANTSNYWQITGVQLEAGPVATPFEFEPFETTLRKCQRYYYRNGGSPYTCLIPWGAAINTSSWESGIHFGVTMRTKPTAVYYGGNLLTQSQTGIGGIPTSITIDGNVTSAQFVGLVVNKTSGYSAGTFYRLLGDNSTAAYIAIETEL
jgi:hypothetical protein